MAWSRWDEGQQARAEQWLEEQVREDEVRAGEAPHPNDVEDLVERAKHQPSPRLVRRWTREPGQCRRRGVRIAALRLAVPCTRTASGGWQIPGVGLVRLHAADEIGDEVDVRSCQVVETTRADTPLDKRRYALHVQSGHNVPESLEVGPAVGLDYGIRHAVTISDGQHLDRPDTAELEERAKALLVQAKTRLPTRLPAVDPPAGRGEAAESPSGASARPLRAGHRSSRRARGEPRRPGGPPAPQHDGKCHWHHERPAQRGQTRAQPGAGAGPPRPARRTHRPALRQDWHRHRVRAPRQYLDYLQPVRSEGPEEPKGSFVHLHRLRARRRRRRQRQRGRQRPGPGHTRLYRMEDQAGVAATVVPEGAKEDSTNRTTSPGGATHSRPRQPKRVPRPSEQPDNTGRANARPCQVRYISPNDNIHNAARLLAVLAATQGVPIVAEDLDFRKKKSWLKHYGKRFAEVLSMFRSRQVMSGVERQCRRRGVEVIVVDPAWTTKLPKTGGYPDRYRIGIHHAAALVIGRRGLGFAERVPTTTSPPVRAEVKRRGTRGWESMLVQRLPGTRRRRGGRDTNTRPGAREGPVGTSLSWPDGAAGVVASRGAVAPANAACVHTVA